MKVQLREIAYARSGDKGTNANVGVAARRREDYELLKRLLTEEVVGDYFGDLPLTGVKRYELANLGALNFILENGLAGGATDPLRLDPQGKTLGESLMLMEVDVPDDRS
jgi:hypothetical protein